MLKVEVTIKGHIDPGWKGWFEGLDIKPSEKDTTQLTGCVPDQSALYGILSRLRDLGLELITIESTELPHDNS
jgi:hypothetical protein